MTTPTATDSSATAPDANPVRHRPQTDRTRRALHLARDLAVSLAHPCITTGHLVWGLMQEGRGLGGKLLVDSGVSQERIGAHLLVGMPRVAGVRTNDLAFTPAVERVMASANERSGALRRAYVGTEHLLMAICHDVNSYGASLIVSVGGCLGALDRRVLALTEFDALVCPPGAWPPEPLLSDIRKQVAEISLAVTGLASYFERWPAAREAVVQSLCGLRTLEDLLLAGELGRLLALRPELQDAFRSGSSILIPTDGVEGGHRAVPVAPVSGPVTADDLMSRCWAELGEWAAFRAVTNGVNATGGVGCGCESRSPTYPVFRSERHLPDCPLAKGGG